MSKLVSDSQVNAVIQQMTAAQREISEKYNLKMYYTFSSDREFYTVWIDDVPDSKSSICILNGSIKPEEIAQKYVGMAESYFANTFKDATSIAPVALPEEQSEFKVKEPESNNVSIECGILTLYDLAETNGIQIFPCLYHNRADGMYCIRLQYNDTEKKLFSATSFSFALDEARQFLLELIEEADRKKRSSEIEAQILALQEELKKLNQ